LVSPSWPHSSSQNAICPAVCGKKSVVELNTPLWNEFGPKWLLVVLNIKICFEGIRFLGHHSGSEEYDDKAEGFPQMSPTVAAWLG
jgi:hypothetical protein